MAKNSKKYLIHENLFKKFKLFFLILIFFEMKKQRFLMNAEFNPYKIQL
jgi:hypothetical protein